MPKRTLEEKLQRYNRKIRKIEQKLLNEKRQTDRSGSSESEMENNDISITDVGPAPTLTSKVYSVKHTEKEAPLLVAASTTPAAETPAASNISAETRTTVILEPDVLLALGDAIDDAPKYGPNIHENLEHRWSPILRKGISKESKDSLFTEYRVPANCSLLQAPKLNVELMAAITDMTRNRDKKIEAAQQQLGVGITALNRAMTLLITGADKMLAIKQLSDSCRILADLHYMDTQTRIKLLTPELDKSFLNVIYDSERDTTLFGSTLSKKIKASKAIEKRGLQIKKLTSQSKVPSSTITSTAARPRYQDDWLGPSRFQSHRGRRRRQRRPHKSANPRWRRQPPPQ